MGSLIQSLVAFLAYCTNAVVHRLMKDPHERQALALKPSCCEQHGNGSPPWSMLDGDGEGSAV
jgi:hypothetical protein